MFMYVVWCGAVMVVVVTVTYVLCITNLIAIHREGYSTPVVLV